MRLLEEKELATMNVQQAVQAIDKDIASSKSNWTGFLRSLTRFLSGEEIGRLRKLLDEQSGKSREQQADIIRLLLFTGCRRSEIVQLRWSEVRDDVLALADSKTGPRNVPLNAGARRILERQPECGSPFVFPSPRDPARPRGLNLSLWYRVRQEAGIEDVRLRDLRHSFASRALAHGRLVKCSKYREANKNLAIPKNQTACPPKRTSPHLGTSPNGKAFGVASWMAFTVQRRKLSCQ